MKLPYIIAGIAAVGIAIGVMNMPSETATTEDAVATSTPVAATAPLADAGTLKMAVPQMHCQYSCFPRVKEALEATPEIETVELAPQADPTVLDDHAVIVHYKAGFEPGDAIEKLTQEGFADSSVVQ